MPAAHVSDDFVVESASLYLPILSAHLRAKSAGESVAKNKSRRKRPEKAKRAEKAPLEGEDEEATHGKCSQMMCDCVVWRKLLFFAQRVTSVEI